jgi:hypothetical protein
LFCPHVDEYTRVLDLVVKKVKNFVRGTSSSGYSEGVSVRVRYPRARRSFRIALSCGWLGHELVLHAVCV